MACEVAVLNPVAITEGFYSPPQHWSSSPDMSPHYANSPVASSPTSCAQSPPSSLQHSPMMPAVHSPPMTANVSPVHSPVMHRGSPVHINVKQEAEFTCAMTDSQHFNALLSTKPAPPELVPVFNSVNIEGKEKDFILCLFVNINCFI